MENGDKEEESMATLYRAMVTTETDPLRVRDAPETGRIVGHVPKGRTVDVLSTGEWPRIRYGEIVGYASGAYLTRTDEADDVLTDPDKSWIGIESWTKLVSADDGSSIVLGGKWHVAED